MDKKGSGVGTESLRSVGSPVQKLVKPGQYLSSWQAVSIVVV